MHVFIYYYVQSDMAQSLSEQERSNFITDLLKRQDLDINLKGNYLQIYINI